MKNIQKIASAALCGLVLTFAAGSFADGVKQGVATVVRVQGEASYSLSSGPNAVWHPLVAGKVLHAGAIIKTGPGAYVDVVLGKNIATPQVSIPGRGPTPTDASFRGIGNAPKVEQNVIRMSGDSVLGIDKLTVSDTGVDSVSDTELDLQKGRIFASVKKLSATSKYLVKIPNGIAGVRGTVFTLDASGTCAVLKDSVTESVTLPNGKLVTVTIAQGEEFNGGSGQSYQISTELLNYLQGIYDQFGTLYYQVVATAKDASTVYISPTSGNTQ